MLILGVQEQRHLAACILYSHHCNQPVLFSTPHFRHPFDVVIVTPSSLHLVVVDSIHYSKQPTDATAFLSFIFIWSLDLTATNGQLVAPFIPFLFGRSLDSYNSNEQTNAGLVVTFIPFILDL